MLVYSVHKFVLMTWLLIKLNTKIEEKEFEDILTIFLSEVFELFSKSFDFWILLFLLFLLSLLSFDLGLQELMIMLLIDRAFQWRGYVIFQNL